MFDYLTLTTITELGSTWGIGCLIAGLILWAACKAID